MDTPIDHQTHRAALADGGAVYMTERQATRVLYALTSLAQTPLIDHLNIHAIFDAGNTCLWSNPNTEATP